MPAHTTTCRSFRSAVFCCVLGLLMATSLRAQVIEFESGGLQYQTLTREGVTIMIARLPAVLSNYSVIQVSVSNGSGEEVVVRPQDFQFVRQDGRNYPAVPAVDVVREFVRNPSRDDVIKLVGTYEMSLYGMAPRLSNTRGGYESRRQSAIAELSFKNLKAAAAASAIAFVETKLQPGESTDGAVFFQSSLGPLHHGIVAVRTDAGQEFRFLQFAQPPSSQ